MEVGNDQMSKGFKIVIASPPEYDRLVAEIYFEGKFVALVSQERAPGAYDLETPGPSLKEDQISRKVPLPEFLDVVNEARRQLQC